MLFLIIYIFEYPERFKLEKKKKLFSAHFLYATLVIFNHLERVACTHVIFLSSILKIFTSELRVFLVFFFVACVTILIG